MHEVKGGLRFLFNVDVFKKFFWSQKCALNVFFVFFSCHLLGLCGCAERAVGMASVCFPVTMASC